MKKPLYVYTKINGKTKEHYDKPIISKKEKDPAAATTESE